MRYLFFILLLAISTNHSYSQTPDLEFDVSQKRIDFLERFLPGYYACKETIEETFGLGESLDEFTMNFDFNYRQLIELYFSDKFYEKMEEIENMTGDMKVITCLPVASFMEGYLFANQWEPL